MEVKYFQDSHTRVKRRENMICAHVIGTMHNFVSYLSKTTFPRYDAMAPGDPSFIMLWTLGRTWVRSGPAWHDGLVCARKYARCCVITHRHQLSPHECGA